MVDDCAAVVIFPRYSCTVLLYAEGDADCKLLLGCWYSPFRIMVVFTFGGSVLFIDAPMAGGRLIPACGL